MKRHGLGDDFMGEVEFGGDGLDPMQPEEAVVNHSEKQTLYIHSKNRVIGASSDLKEFYEESVKKFTLKKIDDAVFQGSGMTLSYHRSMNWLWR